MPMPQINKRLSAAVLAATLALAAPFVMRQEGKRNDAYSDAVSIPTICYGHTAGVHLGQTKTDAECEVLLKGDLAQAVQAVDDYTYAPLTPYQRAALTSFVFNVGTENYRRSRLLKLLNEGQYHLAANEFLRWDHAGGKVLPGLSKRRAAERALFLGWNNRTDTEHP